MRVLHITPTFPPSVGGIETFVFNLCRYSQSELGIDPLVIDLKAEVSDFESEAYCGVPVIRSPVKHYLGTITWPPSLARYIAWADVIHVHDFRMLGTTISIALQRRGKPMVLSTHGGFFHTGRHLFLKRFYYGTLLPTVLSQYQAIIANSASDFRMICKIHRTVVRIDNPIDYEEFSTVPVNSGDLPNFIYVGRFAPNKRIDRLLAAFRHLNDRGVQFRLTLAGPRSDETQRDLARQLHASGIADKVDVQFDRDKAMLKDMLARSTYFVLASEYEGFGLAAMEAMAAGRLVLLNKIKPLMDFVDDNRSGYLVDFSVPAEAAARIEAIMRLSAADKQDVSAKARARARQSSWSTRIRAFGQVYDDVLRRRGGSP